MKYDLLYKINRRLKTLENNAIKINNNYIEYSIIGRNEQIIFAAKLPINKNIKKYI